MADTASILLGFALGVVSPLVTEFIGRWPKRCRTLRGIATELHDLRATLSFAAQRMFAASRALTPAHMAILRPIMQQHFTMVTRSDLSVAGSSALKTLSDEQYAAAWNQRATEGRGPWPVPYHTPFLELSLGELALFSRVRQAQLLAVLYQLRLFNEKVEHLREENRKTFDASITGANRAAVDLNRHEGQVQLGERALSLIKAISALVDQRGDVRYTVPGCF